MARLSRFIKNLAFCSATASSFFPAHPQVSATGQPIQIRVKTIPSPITIKTPEVFKIELANTTHEVVWLYKETWYCGGLSIQIFDSNGKSLKPQVGQYG